MKQLKEELDKKIKKGGEQTEEGCGEQEWMDVEGEEEQDFEEDD